MPCVARVSTSLIEPLFSEVNWSSSLMRSRIGPTSRCTYFLLANGCVTKFTRFGSSPSQKFFDVGGGIGSLSPVTGPCDVEVLWSAGWLLELVCCASPGRARALLNSRVKNMRDFICYLLHWLIEGSLPPGRPSFATLRLCTLRAKAASLTSPQNALCTPKNCTKCAELFIPSSNRAKPASPNFQCSTSNPVGRFSV